jgi:hypothetical protein
MKAWLVLVAAALVGAGCDVGSGTLSGTGGGTISTGAGAAGGMTGSGGIASGSGGSLPTGAGNAGFPPDPCSASGIPTAPLPADIMIVLDTSASMNDGFDGPCAGGCGAESKWAVASSVVQSIVASETPANWGLQLMTDDGANACSSPVVAVPLGPSNATGIRSELSRRAPGGVLVNPGNTPTQDAIDNVWRHLSERTGDGRRAILLITDGAPDCGSVNDPLASDVTGAVQAIAMASASGFPTLIAGLAIAPEAEASLSQMAQSGGLARAGTPRYFPVSSRADLDAAVRALITQVATCVYTIPPGDPSGITSRSNISVHLDAASVPRDTTHVNGWDYLDAAQTSLQLYGGACDAALAGGAVSVVFLCLLI